MIWMRIILSSCRNGDDSSALAVHDNKRQQIYKADSVSICLSVYLSISASFPFSIRTLKFALSWKITKTSTPEPQSSRRSSCSPHFQRRVNSSEACSRSWRTATFGRISFWRHIAGNKSVTRISHWKPVRDSVLSPFSGVAFRRIPTFVGKQRSRCSSWSSDALSSACFSASYSVVSLSK